MKKNREADYIYDIRTVCGNFKGKYLHADTSALRALRVNSFYYICIDVWGSSTSCKLQRNPWYIFAAPLSPQVKSTWSSSYRNNWKNRRLQLLNDELNNTTTLSVKINYALRIYTVNNTIIQTSIDMQNKISGCIIW